MGVTNRELLEMIKNEIGLDEMLVKTNLSYRQLYYRLNILKYQEYNIKRQFDVFGKTNLTLRQEQNNYTEIKYNKKINSFKALLISDLHLASSVERLDLLNQLYDYCLKENIHIIINAGDLIDGVDQISEHMNKYNSYREQMEYVFDKYPFDQNIMNFICLGNHDLIPASREGLNLKQIIHKNRRDLVVLDNNANNLKVDKTFLTVCHEPSSINVKEMSLSRLQISGHYHKMNLKFSSLPARIQLPSLSDRQFLTDDISDLPGAIVFETLTFDHVKLKYLVGTKDGTRKVGEFSLPLYKQKHKQFTK